MPSILSTALHFDTDQAWLDAICAWAAQVPEVERVWLFGSRVTGVRRAKPDPGPIPDLDIAYTLRGSDPGSLLGLAIIDGKKWSAWLQHRIPVPVQLELAAPEDEKVWPAVREHGVLIYEAAED